MSSRTGSSWTNQRVDAHEEGGEAPGLSRSFGFWTLTIYGVGDILGAGIYAIVGQVAGHAGDLTWLAFLVTMVIAGFSALSYAELGSRYPRSGGEAIFMAEAFGWPRLSRWIGLLVLASGVVSLATITRAFGGYLTELIPLLATSVWAGEGLVPLGFLIGISVLNLWGIRQSSRANVVCTVVAVSGLLLVVGLGSRAVASGALPEPAPHLPGAGDVLRGSALAFYSFIGFEDMVNVAEEVKTPHRTLPRAILAALLTSAVLYVLVAWVATRVVAPSVLAASPGPLAAVVRAAAPGFPAWVFGFAGLFAVANTALLNHVMGSRLLYGMARQGLVPRALAAVHRGRRTPHKAILLISVLALVLTFSGSLSFLAGTTNALLLLVFFLVNGSLIRIQQRHPDPDPGTFRVPRWVPWIGLVFSAGLITLLTATALVHAAIIAGVLLLAAVVRTRSDSFHPTQEP